MKNIIVFGASGDTGRYFVQYLLENSWQKDCSIIAVGGHSRPEFAEENVTCLQIDITRKEEFRKLPQQAYAIVDLAGLMPARMAGYNPYRYIDVNIIGTLNILEYCRAVHADRVLYAQSFGDIKDHAEKDPLLTVDLPRQFSFTSDHTVYVLSKNFAVDLIENYHQMYGLKRFIFRLPTIYLWSPVDFYYVDGVRRKIGYRILIDKALKGEDLEVWGDYSRVKDMIYVKDFAQMLDKALFVDRAEGYYNVGTGVGITLLEQIQGIAKVFNPAERQSKLIFQPDKPNAPQYIMDIEPARRELGYMPRYDYLSMLTDMKKEKEKWDRSKKK